VRVRADDVTIEGFDIDGRLGGDLSRDSAGIHVAARRVAVRDCRIERALFGVYLREAHEALIERTEINGVRGKEPGEQGSGIHVWNTTGFRLLGNTVRYSRDGFYLQSSSHGRVAGSVVSEVRYGLHYMFSDDNVFEDNLFERSAAGAALMYSKRLTFRRNRFVHNRGFASVGLLLKACDDVIAEDNLIADNARGVFLEGSYRNQFRRNVIAMSDTALVVYDSSGENVFEGNSFVANLTPLLLSGRRTDTRFAGNYWSDHAEPDLDGDGAADRPYRLSNVFDHVRGNLTAADLFAHGAAVAALGAAERTFPVLDPVPVMDARPLARPPELPQVPAATRPDSAPPSVAAVGPWLLLAGGTGLLAAGRRGWRTP
jgi:nitrous oxidase accessory protein